MKTAADLNVLLAPFRDLQMSAPFPARFAGVDGVTGTHFAAGISIRMLNGQPLLRQPYGGAAGVEVLELARSCHEGRFVDDVEGDGSYLVVNSQGKAVEFTVTGDQVYAKSNYGRPYCLQGRRPLGCDPLSYQCMAKKSPARLFTFLDGLETREDDIRKRLQRILRRIPDRPHVLTEGLSAPSVPVEVALMKGIYSRALELAQMAIEVAPEDPDCWVAMAKALGSQNALKAARQALGRAAELGGAGAEFNYWSAALAQDDRLALEYILPACESDPSFGEALFLAARLAGKLGWEKEGQALLGKCGPHMAASTQRRAYERFLARAGGRRGARAGKN